MVARRRNEIGVRVALGADRGCVVRPVLREAVLLLAIGIAIGMAVLLLSTVALLASYWPAMRAARLEPMSALRED
jgi:ABC-type lipoprotein release transport system permease subunit